MKLNDKLKLSIKLGNEVLHCLVIQNDANYQVILYDTEVVTIQLNKNEKWVQLNGTRLPEQFIGELGMHIEASHRQALFAEN